MIYNVVSNEGQPSTLVPVSNGTFYTESMVRGDKFLEHSYGDFAVSFYDADGVTPITPTGGLVRPSMATTDNVFMAAGVGDAVIEAANVVCEADGLASYSVPVFAGGAKLGKVVLENITGASFMKAEFRRYK